MFSDTTFQFSSLWPLGLIMAAAVALAGAVVFATVVLLRKGVRPGWVTLLALLRFGAVAAFLLLVLQPVFTYTRAVEQRPELLVLVDASRSMAHAAGSGKGSRLEEVLAVCQKGKLAGAPRATASICGWFAFDRTARPLAENELTAAPPRRRLDRGTAPEPDRGCRSRARPGAVTDSRPGPGRRQRSWQRRSRGHRPPLRVDRGCADAGDPGSSRERHHGYCRCAMCKARPPGIRDAFPPDPAHCFAGRP